MACYVAVARERQTRKTNEQMLKTLPKRVMCEAGVVFGRASRRRWAVKCRCPLQRDIVHTLEVCGMPV